MKKIRDLLIRIDVACTILQGRCESMSDASYEKGFPTEEAYITLLKTYNHLMESNSAMVNYLNELYKEKRNADNTNSSSDMDP